MKRVDGVAAAFLVLGGLNWGLVGLFQFDLVAALFGEASALSRSVYRLVGFGAVHKIAQGKEIQRPWGKPRPRARA